MLPHLTMISKTFQIGELNFSQINTVIEIALFIIKEVDDKHAPLESIKKICLEGYLCVRKISITEEMEITRKTNKYAESTVKILHKDFQTNQ